MYSILCASMKAIHKTNDIDKIMGNIAISSNNYAMFSKCQSSS